MEAFFDVFILEFGYRIRNDPPLLNKNPHSTKNSLKWNYFMQYEVHLRNLISTGGAYIEQENSTDKVIFHNCDMYCLFFVQYE